MAGRKTSPHSHPTKPKTSSRTCQAGRPSVRLLPRNRFPTPFQTTGIAAAPSASRVFRSSSAPLVPSPVYLSFVPSAPNLLTSEAAGYIPIVSPMFSGSAAPPHGFSMPPPPQPSPAPPPPPPQPLQNPCQQPTVVYVSSPGGGSSSSPTVLPIPIPIPYPMPSPSAQAPAPVVVQAPSPSPYAYPPPPYAYPPPPPPPPPLPSPPEPHGHTSRHDMGIILTLLDELRVQSHLRGHSNRPSRFKPASGRSEQSRCSPESSSEEERRARRRKRDERRKDREEERKKRREEREMRRQASTNVGAPSGVAKTPEVPNVPGEDQNASKNDGGQKKTNTSHPTEPTRSP